MKKKFIFTFLLTSLVISLLISGCTKSETYIKNSIDKANYCDSKQDCTKINAWCPFGCNVYVNSLEKDKIQKLVNSFESNCDYKCRICDDVECKNNKCEPVCK